MTSKLGALFQEARNTVRVNRRVFEQPVWLPIGRVENFLTEVVSLATLDDWRPLGVMLSDVDVLREAGPISAIRPYTQQRVVAGGNLKDHCRLDLVLAIEGAAEGIAEVWVEVKAGSPFKGDQVRRYLCAIDRAQDGVQRRLVILGNAATKELHKDGTPVRTVGWDQVAEVARSASPIWREIAEFLGERSLTKAGATRSRHTLPTPRLAEVITGALLPSIQWCRWPHGNDAPSVARSIETALLRSAKVGRDRYVRIYAPSQFTYVELGSSDPSDLLSVRLGLTAPYGIPHEVLRRLARSWLPADGAWSLGLGREDDVILQADATFSERDAPSAGTQWLRARLTQLEDAGLLLDLDGDGRIHP